MPRYWLTTQEKALLNASPESEVYCAALQAFFEANKMTVDTPAAANALRRFINALNQRGLVITKSNVT